MINILRRIILILNSWLHAFTASAEDPRETFAVAYQRQRTLLDKVRYAQGKISASRGQLKEKVVDSEKRVEELNDRARQALVDGQEGLARFALKIRVGTEREAASLRAHLKDLDHEEQALELVEQRLEAQIQAFAARQEVLEAQFSTAEAQVRVQEELGGVSEELVSLGDALEQAEERTERMQARASAMDSLLELGILEAPGQTSGDHPALQPAGPSDEANIDQQLASLKQRIEHE